MREAILAACAPGEVRAALIADGMLAELRIWRPGSPDGIGDLHRGRVAARIPALAGAFVTIDGADGFLPDSAGIAGLAEGTLLGVRVVRAAQGGKGPRLTARLAPDEAKAAAEGRVRLVRRGPGALLDLAAEFPEASVCVDEPALAAALRPALGARLTLVAQSWPDDLDAEVSALGEPVAVLPCGMRARFDPTPALVAIDLDSAGAIGTGATGTGATGMGATGSLAELNRAAFPALARQVRLRNLSGAILVDLAGLSPRRRAALGPDLAAALACDPLRPRLLGFTALGLAEIVRPRIRPPLHELLAGPLAAGLAALRRIAREVAANPARPRTLRAAPTVIAALEADAAALAAVARRAGRPLMLRSDPAVPPHGWTIEE
ncbi:MAG TPA: ribonuclease E/G [Acetobacteraceae bacterium]|nr:ribonuclease E/G [Acetobacteraceae bacterium]